jgi:hypothetical protein
MHLSYLSYRYVTNFVKFATDTGLLDYNETTKVYTISRRGREYLKSYTKIEDFLKDKQTVVIAFIVSFFYASYSELWSLLDFMWT